MECEVSSEQLWSWVDRDAPELADHLESCNGCRERTAVIRRKMRLIAAGSSVVVPELIGQYRIRRLIGEGGQALVYEAEQPDPGRTVALKVLKGGRFASERLVKHFRRECAALARFQHPAIATIYEAGHSDEGLHYFAMQYVDGVSLSRHIEQQKPSHAMRLALFLRICEGVAYAHRRGVVHLDLKPSNIVIDTDGEPRILDFGLARITRADTQRTPTTTRTGQIAGTPRYMSPEQARGHPREIDARSDVYSLGVILYELLTDRPPHDILEFTPQSLRALYEDPASAPSTFDRSVGRELDTIVLKALEKRADRRYQSVADLAEDIRRLRDHQPILATPPGRAYRLRKALHRQRIGVAVLTAALAVAAFVGWSWFERAERAWRAMERSRLELLVIRRDLLRGTPNDLVRYRAEDAARFHPGVPEALMVRAHAVYLSRPDGPHVASQYLERVLEQHPDRWPYRLLLAEIEGQEDPATPLRAGLAGDGGALPDSAEGLYLRSFATLDTRESLELAERAIRSDATHLPSLATVALLSPIVGDVERSVEVSSRLVELDRYPDRWLRHKVEVLFAEARYAEAIDDCNALIDRVPLDRSAHVLRARTLRRAGRHAAAARDYTTAIELGGAESASSTWLYYHRGTLLWMSGQNERAAADYERAYRSLYRASHANARLFLVLHELGRADEARAALAEARQRVSKDPWLAQILACLSGERSPAELVAAAADPVQRCEAYYYAGEASRMRGAQEQAISYFEACLATGLESDPDEFWEPMSEFELARWRLGRTRRPS